MSSLLVVLFASMLLGCSDGSDEVVVPNKPPLSAEEAGERARKVQEARVKAMLEDSERKKKK